MVRNSSASAAAAGLPSWARVVQKGQQTDALLKRLKALRSALTNAEQDEIQVSVLDQIRAQLSQDDIMFHKNKDVRSTLACCLAELLRLYAPDCPYSDDELCVIFNFFLAVLTSVSAGLGKPSGATYADCVSLLGSLVAMRAFALLCDRGVSDKIVVDYCKKFFGLIKPDTPKNVEILLSEALSLFIQYGNSVPADVVETLIANFHPLVKQHNPAAAHLAQLVGNAAADELQTSVAQYFADSILQAAQVVDEDERESKLHSVHLLIVQIAKSSPDLLFNVIPQLEEEMRAEDVRLRLISVRTLGLIFSDRTSASRAASNQASTVKKYQGTWKMWLGRAWDKSSSVRIAWVESIKGLLSHDVEVNTDLLPYVEQRLIDSDEKVRSATAKSFASLDYATLRSYVPRAVLQTLGERVKDKKYHIRVDALHALGRAFNLAYSDMASGNSDAIAQFSWIPSTMVSGLFAGDMKGMLLALQAAFEKHILPFPKAVQDASSDATVKRMCFVLEHLDDESANAFGTICNLRGPRGHLKTFLDVCKDFNGGLVERTQADAIQKALLRHISLLANQFADPLKAGQDIHSWAKLNDNRAFKLLESLMSPTADLKTIIKVRTELNKRLGEEPTGTTMLSFVRMASFPFVNTAIVPELLIALDSESDKGEQSVDHVYHDHLRSASKAAMRIFRLLKIIATERAEMLTCHIDTFRSDLHSESISCERRAASIMALAKLDVSSVTTYTTNLTDSDIERLTEVIRNGTWNETKWASKLLSRIASNVNSSAYATAFDQAERLCTSFVEARLHEDNPNKMVGALVTLRQITKRARDAMADSADTIIEVMLSKILMQPYSAASASESGSDWIDDEALDAHLLARLHAMRFLTDRSIAYADHDESEEIVRPVLRLLLTCLKLGEAAPGLCQLPGARARIRLEASLQMLKLARKTVFDRMISVQDFQLLSSVLQDEVYNVRHQIVRRLMRYMLRRSAHLPARFYVLSFVVAFDPEDDMRNVVRETCARLVTVMKPDLRLRYFDVGLARLIHLLNHHPDYENAVGREQGFTIEILSDAARYIQFYLDCCASRDNLACLHHIANRCKGMRDVFDEERQAHINDDGVASQGIHTLSDLSMCLIRRRAELFGTTIGDWQGEVGLPRDLYVPYASRDEQVKVYKRSYLSNEAIELFQQPARRERATVKMTASKRKATPHDIVEQKHIKRAKVAGAKALRKMSSTRRNDGFRSDDTESDSGVADDDSDAEGASSHANDDAPISDDETVEPSEAEDAAGRGVRVRRRLRHEKRLRNEGRRQRRAAREAQ